MQTPREQTRNQVKTVRVFLNTIEFETLFRVGCVTIVSPDGGNVDIRLNLPDHLRREVYEIARK